MEWVLRHQVETVAQCDFESRKRLLGFLAKRGLENLPPMRDLRAFASSSREKRKRNGYRFRAERMDIQESSVASGSPLARAQLVGGEDEWEDYARNVLISDRHEGMYGIICADEGNGEGVSGENPKWSRRRKRPC